LQLDKAVQPLPSLKKFSTTPASSGTAGREHWRIWAWRVQTPCSREPRKVRCRCRTRQGARRLQRLPYPLERRRPRHPHPYSEPRWSTRRCSERTQAAGVEVLLDALRHNESAFSRGNRKADSSRLKPFAMTSPVRDDFTHPLRWFWHYEHERIVHS
jgi:hypothetical protein